MKKVFFIIPIVLVLSFAVSSLLPHGNMPIGTLNKAKISDNKVKDLTKREFPELMNPNLSCKTCHASDYPTRNDPGLYNCPRENLLIDFPTANEGPGVVVIDEMSENYSGVVFSHRIHSQMSAMSFGCTECHHYNTTGTVLNCRECHNKKRSREDISIPDLKAAFHRQCMSCHKEWSHENGCNSQCHFRKNQENQNFTKENISGKEHPERKEPTKMVWETNYNAGKIVTFYHDEHNKLFKINCIDCHKNDRCVKCHDKPKTQTNNNKPVQIKKSFEEHHKLCMNCHKGNSCDMCHRDKEMSPFNHGKSAGWILKSYHSQLACARCHGNKTPFRKVDRNCKTCHDNFVTGKFDHTKTGLKLSENHKELECNSCHANDDFSKTPECKMCHDDKSFPAHLPGKK